MIVTGLSQNRYLTGNGVKVEIAPDSGTFAIGTKISMTVTKLVTHPGDILYTYPPITLYPSPSGLVIDLAPYIRGLVPYPYVPTTNYQDPIPNYQNFNIAFSEDQTNTSATFLNKTFVRGFRRTWTGQGQTLGATEILSPIARIPYWEGWPIAIFKMDNNTIKSILVVPSEDSKQMRVPAACTPLYVRFMNSLGGYSFWMFNQWEWSTKSNPLGSVQTITEDRSLGFGMENNIVAHSRVKEEHYPLIRDLIVSPVIQVYQTGADPFKADWTKVDAVSNNFNANNYDSLQEVSISFALNSKTKASIPW